MHIHNILEEKVLNRVDDLYTHVKEMKAAWLACDCEQCRLDTAAYVLNKLPPKYIVSERGLTHSTLNEHMQFAADMDALIIDGMKKVAGTMRPFHAKIAQSISNPAQGPAFNFPTFIGYIYEGNTFEPIKEAVVTLSQNGETSKMVDGTWPNPHVISAQTKGAYSFWVKPVSAPAENRNSIFNFTIDVTAQGFGKTTYAFDVPIISSPSHQYALNSAYSLKIQDLYLFSE